MSVRCLHDCRPLAAHPLLSGLARAQHLDPLRSTFDHKLVLLSLPHTTEGHWATQPQVAVVYFCSMRFGIIINKFLKIKETKQKENYVVCIFISRSNIIVTLRQIVQLVQSCVLSYPLHVYALFYTSNTLCYTALSQVAVHLPPLHCRILPLLAGGLHLLFDIIFLVLSGV